MQDEKSVSVLDDWEHVKISHCSFILSVHIDMICLVYPNEGHLPRFVIILTGTVECQLDPVQCN